MPLDFVSLPALAAKLEFQHFAQYFNVLITQRGQPESSVLFRIFLISDPNVAGFKQPYDSGQDRYQTLEVSN